MENKDFYDIIFKRKSIRKYSTEPVNEKMLNDITVYMDKLKPMYDNIKVEMNIVKNESVKNLIPIKAPHYILVSSENKEGYLTNAGFMIQQIDLFLSANGLGSCWVGMAKPKKKVLNTSKLEYVIALAFGNPAETLYRDNISQFKRKAIEDIRDNNQEDELIESARIAPSATNSQPWFFRIGDGKIDVYCVKSNFVKAIIYKKINQIDIGIAVCHLWIATRHFGNNLEIILDKEAKENYPSGYYYIMSLAIS